MSRDAMKLFGALSGMCLGTVTGLYIWDQPIRRGIEDILKKQGKDVDLPPSVVTGSTEIARLKQDPKPEPPPKPTPKQTRYRIISGVPQKVEEDGSISPNP